MTDRRLFAGAALAIGALILLSQTVYQLDQRQQALIVRFGDPIREVESPGLHLKTPFVENVVRFDNRSIALNVDQEEIMASNAQRLVVDAFVRYRVTDPRQFYRTLRDERTAADRLTRLVNSSLRQELGRASSEEIVSGGRAALTKRTRDDMVRRAATSNLGVQVIDVRIKRADLPEANQQAVFERMRTARQREAAELRAKGEQQRLEIIATGTEEAEKIRGQADAQRAQLFAESFGRDPGFAAFYRSMSAYEKALGQGDTTLVLSPDSAFFKYFEKGPAG
ncbi:MULTISPECIES: protease modulator HflC [Caulobacter]|jgi:membrane protease subunit HflC|uniref:Membrane protease subunit HflC n=1 Tax=Caulobacter rhizosphaerae TaxID=2010972 RepID=A0ABU1N026_9CAUL|nr:MULTISPECIES: protease modulator HflC [Caulobacter]KQZ18253.1 protease modulator HflC [Caulobacter sp. Root1472]MDR6531652.1 membrane protease subunit HflC [Caulobacter rhizosphaerae]GGL38877.1 protein HflC [Caulobacter rhizosphaerae]